MFNMDFITEIKTVIVILLFLQYTLVCKKIEQCLGPSQKLNSRPQLNEKVSNSTSCVCHTNSASRRYAMDVDLKSL